MSVLTKCSDCGAYTCDVVSCFQYQEKVIAMKEREEEFKAKYNCTASDNGGWCNGHKVGASMRCPARGRLKDGSGYCEIGIEAGYDEMDRLADEMSKPTTKS